MAFEVVNTSVAAGLLPGRSGFCDVIRTTGIPEAICSMLGPLSSYRQELAGDASTFAIRRLRYGGSTWGVVSCVSPCGVDYTGRGNRIAHHVVVPPSELASTSPARLLGGYAFRVTFDGAPRFLTDPPSLGDGGGTGVAWSTAGLSGWEHHVRERLREPNSHLLLLLPDGLGLRELLAELLDSLTVEEQWRVGVMTACNAKAAWDDGVGLRVLSGDHPTLRGASDPWPDEQLLDLRARPPVPIPPRRPSSPDDGASPGDRWIEVPPPDEPLGPPDDLAELSGWSESDLDIGVVVDPGAETHSKDGEGTDRWSAWLRLSASVLAGSACGMTVAFLMWRLGR